MTEAYCFRQRFELAPGGRLPFSGHVEQLAEGGGVAIRIRSLEHATITESTKLAVWGSGYDSPAAAEAAGEHWRSTVQRALAAVGLGANFGLRNPDMGGLVDTELERVRREEGVTVYRDSWDLLVFPCEPRPMFSSMAVEGYVTPNEVAVRASFGASRRVLEPANEVAFDLYAASMRSAHMADVRVVLLVMAIECLLERERRSLAALAHIESLVDITLSNDALDNDDRDALANAIRSLRHESTTRAAKRLAGSLQTAAYPDDPVELVSEAFKMRNALVHGRGRPDLIRVRYVGANLERIVGDFIAGPVVSASVRDARTGLG